MSDATTPPPGASAPSATTAPDTSGAGATSGATIELENLTKIYAGTTVPAVENVSLEIKAGETVVFVGPSGGGKTTLLKMINRLIEPSSGRIRIGGEDVTDMDPVKLRRKIGYAIQSSGLFPHLTVAQNIALVPKMIGWSKSRVKERVEEMLDLVGLDPVEFRGRYPRQLSGGQQQRVGVARALAADPPVLLMDEPFGAVDPITRDHLQDELIRLQHELHKTIVFVTHDFDEAIKIGDRIAVLRDRSKIAQFDTPEAILTNPADDFVSGFVGAGAALKRLNLTRVRDVGITDWPTVSVDDPLQTIFDKLRDAGHNELLMLDRRERPYKWLRRGDLSRAKGSLSRAGALVQDTVTRDATLRDALEAVLTDNAGRVAVTGRRGEYEGVVDMQTLMNSVHELLEEDRLEAIEHRHELEEIQEEQDPAHHGRVTALQAEEEGAGASGGTGAGAGGTRPGAASGGTAAPDGSPENPGGLRPGGSAVSDAGPETGRGESRPGDPHRGGGAG
ncbi:betaine/proline/choline family ABC transporter ATP-binding protein [Streptomyces sp. Tu6071]|uniref:betaine/proline/choline family ABC transporter ATP-binding protein n=1 Tax=Streptomyces sp. Tu6071 TaxID=355249 RepID=UPI0002EF934C